MPQMAKSSLYALISLFAEESLQCGGGGSKSEFWFIHLETHPEGGERSGCNILQRIFSGDGRWRSGARQRCNLIYLTRCQAAAFLPAGQTRLDISGSAEYHKPAHLVWQSHSDKDHRRGYDPIQPAGVWHFTICVCLMGRTGGADGAK